MSTLDHPHSLPRYRRSSLVIRRLLQRWRARPAEDTFAAAVRRALEGTP